MISSASETAARRARILIVEDEGIVAAHIASQLAMTGYDVAGIAQSSEEVLANIPEWNPDLILMDIRIKGPLDGIATTNILRERFDIPVIYLTAHTDQETVDRAKITGASNFLTKPIHHSALRISIEMAVHKHRADREIRQQRAWMATLLNTMADAMAVIDHDGAVQYLNGRAEALTGWDNQEARGKQIAEILPLEEAASGMDVNDLLHPDPSAKWPGQLPQGLMSQKRSGKKFPIGGEMALSFDQERVVGAVITFRDDTARQALESERRQVHKMQAVGRLAAGIAHDFNNLLFVILGYAEALVGSAKLTGTELHALGEIRKAGETAAAITQQLLQFSRSEPVKKYEIDLNALIRETEDLYRRLASGSIKWQFVYAQALSPIRADQNQLKQVLMNLVANARDAMPEGGRITIETANVDVPRAGAPSSVRDSYIALSVSDTGIGMKPEVADRLFEPFFTTKDLGKGTGLGLSIVHSIVADLSGSIQVESEPGEGSTFTIYLPRAKAEAGAPAIGQPEPAENDQPAMILLAEDNPAVRGLLRKFLEPGGYQFLEAEDGEEAIRIGTEYEGPIDLLITDIMMPKANGFEVSQALSKLRDLATIFISGYAEEFVRGLQGIPSDARFLPKPFFREDLLRNVAELLKQRKGNRMRRSA